jgi:hypothetical protein
MKEVKIEFTKKELELLTMLAGAAMMDKGIIDSYEIDFQEKLALNNKLRYLLILAKKNETKV